MSQFSVYTTSYGTLILSADRAEWDKERATVFFFIGDEVIAAFLAPVGWSKTG